METIVRVGGTAVAVLWDRYVNWWDTKGLFGYLVTDSKVGFQVGVTMPKCKFQA